MNGTDNNIGAEGARMISESLKINTTLTTLDLTCNMQRSKKKKRNPREREKKIKRNKKTKTKKTRNNECDNGTGTNIGDEGARMISESLKINTTLTELDLRDDI